MAAKKSRTSKKSAHASEGVTVQLDSDYDPHAEGSGRGDLRVRQCHDHGV